MSRTSSSLRKKYDLGEAINDRAMINFLDKNKIRSHISHSEVTTFDDTPQELLTGFNGSGRPDGLWFGIGSSWLDFLVQNKGILLPQYKPCCFLYEIKLNPKKILRLNTIKKFQTFDKKYENYWRSPHVLSRGYSYVKNSANYPLPLKRLMKKPLNKDNYFNTLTKEKLLFETPDTLNKEYQLEMGYKLTKKETEYWKFKRWDQISNDYTGVEFNPYFSNLSKKFFWYNTLDVASGCVWNKNGISSINLIAVKPNNNDHWELTEYSESL